MKNIFSIVVVLFAVNVCFGWGQTGHRVVGLLAENHLNKKTREKLKEIMGVESLVEASTWMDEIKSDKSFKHMNSWHYVSIPDGQTYATCTKSEKGDVYEAINRMIVIIKDDSKSKKEKRDAICSLTHLVGDMHQPLHVGNGTDKGGNSVKVKWFYQSSNLHRVWDSEMIDSKKYSYSELADLIDDHSKDDITKWQSEGMDVWVNEAMSLRTQIYNTGDTDKMGYRYMYENWNTLRERLLKAGIRLAGILNEALS